MRNFTIRNQDKNNQRYLNDLPIVVLNTGRESASVKNIYDTLKNQYTICGNGSIILDKDFNIIRKKWIPKNIILNVIQHISKVNKEEKNPKTLQNICLDIDYDHFFIDSSNGTCDEAWLAFMKTDLTDELYDWYSSITTIVKGDINYTKLIEQVQIHGDAQRISIVSIDTKIKSEASFMKEMEEMIIELGYQDQLKVQRTGMGHGGVIPQCEIVMSNLGKREALKFLCQYLHKNDDGSEVISFGDSTNDNEMLEYSKLSFAPSNGRISTKQAAKEVSIYNNNEEYVARILEKLYLRPPSTSSIIDNIINNNDNNKQQQQTTKETRKVINAFIELLFLNENDTDYNINNIYNINNCVLHHANGTNTIVHNDINIIKKILWKNKDGKTKLIHRHVQKIIIDNEFCYIMFSETYTNNTTTSGNKLLRLFENKIVEEWTAMCKEGHYWPGHGENIYKEAIDISISTDTTREILYRYLHIQNNGPVEESTNLTHKNYVRNVENGEQISHSASVTVDRLDKFLQSGAQYFLQNCSCENNYGCIRFSICMPSGDEMIIDDNGVLTSGNNNNHHHHHHNNNNIVLKPSATLLQFYQFKRFENDEIKIAEAWYAIVPVGETIESRWPDCSIQRINFFDENKIDSNKSSL